MKTNLKTLSSGLFALLILFSCGQSSDPGTAPSQASSDTQGNTAQEAPTPAPTGAPETGTAPLSDPERCKLLARLMSLNAKSEGFYSAHVARDGTCVISDPNGDRAFPRGTTSEVRHGDDGVLIVIIREPASPVMRVYYARDKVIIVTEIKNDARLSPKISLNEQFHFDFDSSTIKNVDTPILQTLTQVIFGLLETESHRIRTIEVQGHTDDIGPSSWNLDLSEKRANAVRSALINALMNIPRGARQGRAFWEALFEAKGYGASSPASGPSARDADGRPIFTNADRELNRRVEFRILEH